MGVKSARFGGVELTGEEAIWFKKRMKQAPKRNELAMKLLEKGRELVRQNELSSERRN